MKQFVSPPNFINIAKEEKFLVRLKKVTTMMPPPNRYINRYEHTFDVIKVAGILIDSFNCTDNSFPFLKESCLIHDIGHCCFAHEMELVLNTFISKYLNIPRESVGFSHAINGALVLALSSNPTTKKSSFSELNLFKNFLYKDFVDIIVDSMVKHSINESVVTGVYGKFVCKYYGIKTGHSINLSSTPNYPTGKYVRVADDIATKNSDVLDLIQHHYDGAVDKSVLLGEKYHYKIASYYVSKIKQSLQDNTNIEDALSSIPEYDYEKKLLKISYHFSYKEEITKKIVLLTGKLLDVICVNPFVMKKLYKSSRSLSFIKYVFEHSSKEHYGKDIKMNVSTIRKLANEYNLEKSKQSIKVYNDYICSIAYEISNFTDEELLKLFDRNKDIFSECEIEIINNLLNVYRIN